MDPDQQLRNLRDFLLVYNRMTEICFQRCTSNFNYRNLTMDEERCVDSCAGKLIRSNHRLMGTYVQLMPRMVQRRMEEMESKAAENAKAAEAEAAAAEGASGAVGTAITEASPAPQPPIAPSPNTQVTSFLSPSLTDVGADVHGSALKPAALDIPAEVNGAVSTSATEVKLSAAAALTPATETVNPSVLNKAGNGPSYMTGLSQPPVAGAQIDSGSSTPLLMPSQPTAFSDGALKAAPPALKSESLSGQDKAPQAPTPTTNS